MYGTLRLVNDHDIVPHLPPEDFGFRHYPQEVWERPAASANTSSSSGVTASDTYFMCSSYNGEDESCSDGVMDDLSVSDHLNYMQTAEDSSQCR